MKHKVKPSTLEFSCLIHDEDDETIMDWVLHTLGHQASIVQKPKKAKRLNIYLKHASEASVIKQQLLNYSTFSDFIVKKIPFDHWASRWKKGLRHINISKSLVIRPSWVRYQKKRNETVVQIDPGMAFGTGHHSTTLMCLEWIDQFSPTWEKSCDLGCGSGILSICALKRGVRQAWALDHDQESIDATLENAHLNKVKINCLRRSISTPFGPHHFDAVFVNLTAFVIKRYWKNISRRVSRGMLLLSGIHESHSDDFHQWLIKRRGWNILERKQKKEWLGYLLVRIENRNTTI